VAFFLMAFSPKPCMHSSSLPRVLHSLPISSSLTSHYSVESEVVIVIVVVWVMLRLIRYMVRDVSEEHVAERCLAPASLWFLAWLILRP
jgi:hypothetical protein